MAENLYISRLVSSLLGLLVLTGCENAMESFSRLDINKSISLKVDGATALSVNEGSTLLIVPVMSKVRTSATTIHVDVSSARSDTGDHFTTVRHSSTIQPGIQATAVSIPILHDVRYSGDRDYTLTVSSPEISDTFSLTATVEDLESPPTVNLASSAISLVENAGTQSIAVTLSVASTNSVTIPFTVNNITTTDADRTFLENSVTFAPGQTSRTISYTIVDDATVETSEDFSIQLNAPPALAATLGTNTLYTVTIVDDDQPSAPTLLTLTNPGSNINSLTTPTFLVSGVEAGNTVRLYSDASCSTLVASGVASATTISMTSSALAQGTYEFAATRNNASGTFSNCSTTTVDYTVDSTPVTVTMAKLSERVDENVGNKTFDITMSATKPYDVVLSYNTAGTTASSALIGGFTSGTVTIPAGQTTAAITVAIGADAVGNVGEQRVQVNLTKTNSALVRMGALHQSRFSVRDIDQTVTSFNVISAGTNHTCGISNSSQLYCWGYNSVSRLGDGTVIDRSKPVLIDGATSYSFVSAGYKTGCAITTTGVLKCWGSGYWGSIGDGANTDRSTPVIADSGITYKKVSVGKEGHACGITTDDKLKCWGDNGDGQLGDTTTTSRNTPVEIDTGVLYKEVAAGRHHSCAITTANKLKCWGNNGNGRLGDGTSTNRSSPTAIDAATDYLSVSLGADHSCAIDSSNVLKCWGDNRNGELGDGSNSTRNTPTTVSGANTFSSVSAGGEFTCGVRMSGALECWGTDEYYLSGQLGDGSMTRKNSPQTIDAGVTYSKVTAGGTNHTCGITTTGLTKCWGGNQRGHLGDGKNSNHFSPVAAFSDATYSKTVSGHYHTCGITTTGGLRCWGSNTDSILGDGSTVPRSVAVDVDPGVIYSDVAVNSSHSCAITATGALKCWGSNSWGKIGNNSFTTVSTPTVIDTGVSYKKIAIGNNHTCGITSADVLKCWGANHDGQLGDSTTSFRMTPVVADVGTSYKFVSTGSNFTCGITVGDVVKCWGSNYYGNLGNGTTTSSITPVVADAGTSYSKLSILENHVCGLTTAQEARCWGANWYGHLGDGTTTNRSSAVAVNFGAATNVSDISAGLDHTCAVTAAGAVKCWGNGDWGRVGNGTGSNSNTPVDVDLGTTYSSVSSGRDYSCGKLTNGTFKCWGSNIGGKFSDGVLDHYAIQIIMP